MAKTKKKNKNDNEDIRSRIFEVQSHIHDANGNDIFTKQMINAYIKKRTSKNKDAILWYAWIVHDKDVKTEDDKLRDPAHYDDVKIGELKPPHIHLVLYFKDAQRQTTIANAFKLNKQFVRVPEVYKRGIQLPAIVTYLTHEKEPVKARYSRELIHCSNPEILNEMINNYKAQYPKKLDKKARRKLADKFVEQISRGEISIAQIKEEWGLNFYLDFEPRFIKARQEYMRMKFEMKPRLNYFIEGESGVGKSTVARMLAKALGREVFAKEMNAYNERERNYNDDELYLEVGENKVRFDAYEYQPILIWNDVRCKDLLKEFNREGVLNLLELNPTKRNYNIKYGGIILSNQVNIINGIESGEDFIGGLTKAYTDASGIQHEGEEEKQAYRRFPIILHVDKDYLEIKVNYVSFYNLVENGNVDEDTEEFEAFMRGFLSNNIDHEDSVSNIVENKDNPKASREFKRYETYKVIPVNIKDVNSYFAYDAWDEIAMKIMAPVVDLQKKYMEKYKGQKDKIINPKYLPEIKILDKDEGIKYMQDAKNSNELVDADYLTINAIVNQQDQWSSELLEILGEEYTSCTPDSPNFDLYEKYDYTYREFREMYDMYCVRQTQNNFLKVKKYIKENYEFLKQFPIIQEFIDKSFVKNFIIDKEDFIDDMESIDE